MFVLGLTTMGESAAALFKNGYLVAAVEEERFTRIKHEGSFPVNAIAYCLQQEGIEMSDISDIAVFWQPWRVWVRGMEVLKTAWTNPKRFKRKLGLTIQEFRQPRMSDGKRQDGSWGELFSIRKLLHKNFGPISGKIRFLDHHSCHMANCFYGSPFEESVILSYDGGGEDTSTVLAVGKGEKIDVIKQFRWPNSLGHFYSAMTGFLGFTMLDGEYKMMGLAPYGEPIFKDFIRQEILRTPKHGTYTLNTTLLDYHEAHNNIYHPKLYEIFGPPRKPHEPFTQTHQAIAASVQSAFEEVVFDLLSWAKNQSGGIPNLAIAGGCGLNCTVNGKLLSEGLFEKIYVPPAPHDTGASIGAGMLVCNSQGIRKPSLAMDHAYYGPEFSNEEIKSSLDSRGLNSFLVEDPDQYVTHVVEILTMGRVVAWFQGRMEFGPRALGSRSFLADPRYDSIRETINSKIKKRELFRPFAPSIKREAAQEFFNISQDSPFMNIAADVRADKKELIPAVTHIDGTSRVHSVQQDHNPLYWKLLDVFESKTGIPILLNTSFNIQEPIVCTPDDAINTFIDSNVDLLAIGSYLVTRNGIDIKP